MATDTRGMQPIDRTTRPATGSEQELLEAFLDFQRDTLLWKVSGLDEAALKRPLTPSGMSLLGLVKHLAYVERNWFQNRFLAREVYVPWIGPNANHDADFQFEPGETPEAVIAFYREQVAESKRIVAEAASLETIAADPSRPHSLRRILIHMIEEVARHNGHADILRELTDGQTGE
jgi:uncharacterized damage-inducible protein DinB